MAWRQDFNHNFISEAKISLSRQATHKGNVKKMMLGFKSQKLVSLHKAKMRWDLKLGALFVVRADSLHAPAQMSLLLLSHVCGCSTTYLMQCLSDAVQVGSVKRRSLLLQVMPWESLTHLQPSPCLSLGFHFPCVTQAQWVDCKPGAFRKLKQRHPVFRSWFLERGRL